MAQNSCTLLPVLKIRVTSLRLLSGSRCWSMTSPKSAWTGDELLQEAPSTFTTPCPTPPAPSAQGGAQHHSRDESKGRTRGEGGRCPSAPGGQKEQGHLHKELNNQSGKKQKDDSYCDTPHMHIAQQTGQAGRAASPGGLLRCLRMTGQV